MSGPIKLSFDNFGDLYKKRKQQKLLSEALVYLKLREHGCPKTRALIFAKKKQKVIDGTATKDGPAGFRKLIPQKPQGKLVHGWVKGEKLKYKGLREFSQQLKKAESKQKLSITKYNKQSRLKFEQQRIKLKQQPQLVYVEGEKKKILEQIAGYKDQFLKDRQKRNLFLSCQGIRLDQYTRSYFDKILQQNPDSLILKLAAFQTPINDQSFKIQTDWEIAKGRALSNYEIQGQSKRKKVIQFRRSLTDLSIPQKIQNLKERKFRSTIQNSRKQMLAIAIGKSPPSKFQRSQKQFDQFYNNIDKLVWIKTRKSQALIQPNLNI